MTKNILSRTLFSGMHWFGWILTVTAIILVFHFAGIHSLHTPWYNVLILLGVVTVVDVFKHFVKLQ